MIGWTEMNSLRLLGKVSFSVALGTLLFATAPASGQNLARAPDPLPQLITIAEVLRDSNGDTVPDRLGQKVRVRGVVTIGTGVMSQERLQVYFQDHTAGVYFFTKERGASIPSGSLIEVVGTVEQYRGGIQIARGRLTLLGRRPVPAPLRQTISATRSWKVYGLLAAVEGVVGAGANQGPYLGYELTDGGASIRLLLPSRVAALVRAGTLTPGSKVRVTGVVSIYSTSPPHVDGFQLIVASPEWIEVIAPPASPWIKRMAIGAVALTLAAVIIFIILGLWKRNSAKRKRHSSLLTELSAFAAGVEEEDSFLIRAVQLLVDEQICRGALVHVIEEKGPRLRSSSGLDDETVALVDRFIQKRVSRSLEKEVSSIDPPDFRTDTSDLRLNGLACLLLQGRSHTLGVLTCVPERGGTFNALGRSTIEAAANLLALGIENVQIAHANEDKERELEQLAVSDPLTGLYNRRFMDEYLRIHLAMARRQKAPVSFIAIDLDHFKRVNDSYGHEVGDEVLAEVGQLIRTNVRASDLPVRLGGEEFLLIMPGTDEAGALTFAARLQDAFRKHEYAGLPEGARMTASFGIAIYPVDGESVRTLLRAADESMYLSKRDGRDRITVARGQTQQSI